MEDTLISQEGFQTLEEHNAATPQDEQLTLFDLKAFAVRNVTSMDDLRDKLKTATEMYNDTLKNDPQYQQAIAKAEGVTKEVKEVKTQLQRQPSLIAQEQEIKHIKNEIKEKLESVSHAAMEVYRRTGSNEFTTEDGSTYEIKTVAKLVKRKQ